MNQPPDTHKIPISEPWTLAVEGGGTGSRFGYYTPEGTLAAEWEGPPANPAAYGAGAPVDAALQASEMLEIGPRPLHVLAGIAGLATQRQRVQTARALRDALKEIGEDPGA